MYQLRLTHEERKAIDWVGDRYFHGHELWDLLTDCEVFIDIEFLNSHTHADALLDDLDDYWASKSDVIFVIPESSAWLIVDGLEGEDSFCTCFADELRDKLRRFCEGVV